MFVLLGRVFIIAFGNNPHSAALAVNLMSALASGFTILFLFWTVTHFARKMFVTIGDDLTPQQMVTIMGAGAIGAFAYMFSDSFWFSAVEGEVYGLSSFFTALVFWAMLKWEHASDMAGNDHAAKFRADRWIVFIFFMMGLSIGVHLLNLLTIPAIVMIYYFKRYPYSVKGTILAFLVGCLITGAVQVVVIQYSMKAAGILDIFAVNDFHLPFFSGFTFYLIVLTALIVIGIRFKENKVTKMQLSSWLAVFLVILLLPFITKDDSAGLRIFKTLLIAAVGFVAYFIKPGGLKGIKLGLWCFAFMMLGYSTYFTTLIRSNANPSIDMNNVDNPMSLVYLLSREQYGEAPLIYGPHFMADVKYDPETGSPYKDGEMKYVKGRTKYNEIGKEQIVQYDSKDMQLFPRVWDPSNDQGHANFYAQWLNLGKYNDPNNGQQKFESPTYSDNINWFFTYQMGLMYWRYFMWNFAGKQNDIQGFGNKRDGNWISGISFIDSQRLGDQSKLPDSIKHNKAHNVLFLLPFILGILGCVYHFIKNRKDWIVTFLLFFFTGIAVALYLNQPGNQPRERDYAYVGSFYAFAIWIGLGVVALLRLAREKEDKKVFTNTLVSGAVLTFVITFFSSIYGSGILLPSLMIGAMYAILSGALIYLVRAVSSAGQNMRTANIAAIILCSAVPIIMGLQEWDDHDRSKKTLARDIAIDYLESCAPNAILFTFGDNDTYPLWYAQEVEGVRPDIRIINNSLLGIDWYINQLRYKVNKADSLDVIWTPEQIEGHKREYLRYQAAGAKDRFYDLYDVMKNVLGKDDQNTANGLGSFPVKRFSVPVDTVAARKYGAAGPNDSVLSTMLFEIPENKNVLLRNELVILNIIAANHWKRPIYFTSPFGDLGFWQYLRKDGLSYRLMPVKNKFPQNNWVVDQELRTTGVGRTPILDNNLDWMNKVMTEKFRFGGAEIPGVYFDEENRRHLLSIRATYGEAAGNLADENKKEEANKLLQKCDSMMNPKNFPYAMASRYNNHNTTSLIYLEGCYKAGNLQLAEKVRLALRKDLEQQKSYFDYLRTEREDLYKSFDFESDINDALLAVLGKVEQKYAPQTQPKTTIEGLNPTIINKAADSGAKKSDSGVRKK